MNEDVSEDIQNKAKTKRHGSLEGLTSARPESTKDFLEKAVEHVEKSFGIANAPHFSFFDPSHQLASNLPETQRILIDAAGRVRFLESEREDEIQLTISRAEFHRLTAKTQEILSANSLAHERIAKDQDDIDLLKTETREILKRLRAA